MTIKFLSRPILSTFLLLLSLASSISVNAQKAEKGNVVYFDINVPTLNAEARKTINEMISGHKIQKEKKLLLYGYADYLGTRAHNDSLSTERAMNVRAYLISKGISEDKISICVGKGAVDRNPTADHKGYAQDRKVEIITDEAKMVSLTCKSLPKCEPLNWSKNVSARKVHAAVATNKTELNDNAVTVRLPNGDRYIGEISVDGMKKSKGTYIWSNGDQYTGDYKYDRKDGRGTYTWPNGDKLTGTWEQDQIMAGSYIIPYNGVLYNSDDAQTHTNVVYKGELSFVGSFYNQMLNGHGVAKWPNGDKYDGQWVDDKMTGRGIYIWGTGEKYEGLWFNNKMHGEGVLQDATGRIIQKGTWDNDVFKQ